MALEAFGLLDGFETVFSVVGIIDRQILNRIQKFRWIMIGFFIFPACNYINLCSGAGMVSLEAYKIYFCLSI